MVWFRPLYRRPTPVLGAFAAGWSEVFDEGFFSDACEMGEGPYICF